MRVATLSVTALLAGLLTFSAAADYARLNRVLSAMSRAGVSERWLPTLATLKAAGAVGLAVGILIPGLGVAAAAGVTAFFIGAIVTHVRARWLSIAPAPYFLLAVSALMLTALSL